VEPIYDYEISASLTTSAALATDPYTIHWIDGQERDYWMYAGPTKVFLAHIDNNSSNITRQSATSTSSITSTSPDKDYAVTQSDRWSIVLNGGVAILAARNNTPQYWASATMNVRLADLHWDKSAGTKWSTRTAGAVTCATIRSYREYLIALDTIEGADEFKRRLRWSHPTLTNNTPQTWDENKTQYRAGFRDFDDGGRQILDCSVLGAANYIYTTDTTWRMSWIGGQFEFRFERAFPFGLLWRNCIGRPPGKHFIISDGTMLVHDGVTWDNIGAGKWDRRLFNQLSTDFYKSTFILTYQQRHEIWVCYPVTGPTCDKALVWNWRYNTWGERDLSGSSDIQQGIVSESGVILVYDAADFTYDETVETYSSFEQIASPFDLALVGAFPATASDPALLMRLDFEFKDRRGEDLQAYMLREGLPLTGAKRRGNDFAIDLESVKGINAVWPQIDADSGISIGISIGTRDVAGGTTTWFGPETFVTGTSRFADFARHRIAGRYVSIKFETISPQPWRLLRYGVEIARMGRF
jgi:hypothetical protein